MRVIPLLATSFLVLVVSATTSNSCSCISRALAEHVHETDVIFSGTVIDIFEAAQEPDSLGRMYFSNADPIGYTVVVKDIYKGTVADTVMVWSVRESSACGYVFSLNGTYLIYAVPRSEDQSLGTSLCSATKPLDRATEDLAWLATNPQR